MLVWLQSTIYAYNGVIHLLPRGWIWFTAPDCSARLYAQTRMREARYYRGIKIYLYYSIIFPNISRNMKYFRQKALVSSKYAKPRCNILFDITYLQVKRLHLIFININYIISLDNIYSKKIYFFSFVYILNMRYGITLLIYDIIIVKVFRQSVFKIYSISYRISLTLHPIIKQLQIRNICQCNSHCYD